ncbi:hypothetical protein RRG08_063798 [Elysia crispata]|uniref:Uncharacterized protein n=1 Tax=Elysia crispata TaxID=231223 RepID=A0AAE1AJQ1_9GAST|nr:hypothetical protein RRG08_063798 [Elysia crispata]
MCATIHQLAIILSMKNGLFEATLPLYLGTCEYVNQNHLLALSRCQCYVQLQRILISQQDCQRHANCVNHGNKVLVKSGNIPITAVRNCVNHANKVLVKSGNIPITAVRNCVNHANKVLVKSGNIPITAVRN